MHNLAYYVPYDGKVTSQAHSVLVWSVATGYFFTTFGSAPGNCKIIARFE